MANPFFKKNDRPTLRKPAKSLNNKGRIKIFLIFFAIIYILWLLFFSASFNIKNSLITGLERVDQAEIMDQIEAEKAGREIGVLSENNIFMFNSSSFKNKILDKYNFESLDIKKNYLKRELNIIIKERPCAFTWFENGNYYYIDTTGLIISEKNVIDITRDYLLFENKGEPLINGNKVVISPFYLSKAQEIFDKSTDLGYNLNIERFYVTNNINALNIKILDGPEIIFNINDSINQQLDRLRVLKDEKLKNEFFKLEYVDLRFNDKIYYK